MIVAAWIYCAIALFVFVLVAFFDENTEGEKLTWTRRALTALVWPLFVWFAIVDWFNGELD